MKVELKNIGKKYEGREDFTIRNINLEIGDKEFCVILGSSGCGKSTLLRMIAGLNSITEGELVFGDRVVNKLAPKDRNIAMVFQSYALYPHMTVYDNMAFSLMMRKIDKKLIHDRVLEAAEILKIKDYLYSKPSDISGGQRQRVALGRAIVRKPDIFLMDEPLSNLDAKLREHMRVELVRIHQTLGTTTIYVTHDQTEAMTMADRIVVMKKGVVQQVGSPKEIYDHPENLFVAGFIGAPTMNFMRGRVAEGNFVTKDGGEIEIPIGHYDRLKELGYEGKEVVLGIRPENISNDPLVLETYSHAKITSKVIVAELLGSEYIVHTDLNGESIKAIVHSRQNIKMGDELTFALDMNRAHYFDAETELSILE